MISIVYERLNIPLFQNASDIPLMTAIMEASKKRILIARIQIVMSWIIKEPIKHNPFCLLINIWSSSLTLELFSALTLDCYN